MASGDLPDLWTTHGWAVERYNNFLLPLNDQPWVSSIKEPFKPIITNKRGQVLVLPISMAKDGMVVNKTVLEKSGVQLDSIKTWDDFLTASEKIKNSGFTPVGMWGKDPRSFASFLNFMANPLLISSPAHSYGNDLRNGTFEWTKWNEVNNVLVDLGKKGYLNKDVLTATEEGIDQAMAKDQIAFKFRGSVKSIVEFNPKVNIGIAPIPAYYSDDKPFFSGGEGTVVGVWKDSKNKAEAIKFLAYLAKAENVKRIGDVDIKVTGLHVAESDLGVLTADYKKYENVAVRDFFDRVYLPSGMWSILQQVGAGLVSGQMKSDEATNTMKSNFDRLRSQAK